MQIVIFGPPGVGKGTQAERLVDRYGLCHISTGDALRETIRSGSPRAEKLRAYLDEGALVPDALVAEIIEHRLTQSDCQEGFILDGFPRTLAQAHMLDKLLKRRHTRLDAAIFLDARDEVIVERISGRRVCPRCGRSYHDTFAPPESPGRCDDDGEVLIHRSDDEPEAIRKRLRVYEEETAPLREFFRENTVLIQVDGSQPPEAVERSVITALEREVLALGRNK